jgi:hypothetical protein
MKDEPFRDSYDHPLSRNKGLLAMPLILHPLSFLLYTLVTGPSVMRTVNRFVFSGFK